MNNKFMSLGSMCAPIYYLGENREKGPLDNVRGKGLKTVKLLFEGNYISEIQNLLPMQPKIEIFREYDQYNPTIYVDKEHKSYEFPFVTIVHNNPNQDKFMVELKERNDLFNSFLNNVKHNSNYYFTYTLNNYWDNYGTESFKKEEFEEFMCYLKNYGVLDKTIFVGIDERQFKFHNYKINDSDLKYFQEKYNLIYIYIPLLYKEDECDLVKRGHWKHSYKIQQYFLEEVNKIFR